MAIETLEQAVEVGEAARKLIDAEAAKGIELSAADAVDRILASRTQRVGKVGGFDPNLTTPYSNGLSYTDYHNDFVRRHREARERQGLPG